MVLAALTVAVSLAVGVAVEWPVRPCPPECTCEGVTADLDPKPPMDLIECTIWFQGFPAKLLIPDTEGKNAWGRTEYVGKHSATFNPEMIFNDIGDDNFPYLSVLGLRPGDVVLDVGVAIGTFSLSVAIFHPEVKIIGLEPNPWLAAVARENLRRNGVSADRFRIINAAMTGDGRNVTFNIGRFITTSSIYDLGTFEFMPGVEEQYESKVELPSMTLDHLLAEAGKPAALVKIDCEGCEMELFDTLDHLAMPVFLGCHPYTGGFIAQGLVEKHGEMYWQCDRHRIAAMERFYEQGAIHDPVVAALAGLRAKQRANMTAASSLFQLAVRPGEKQMEHVPPGLARQQYAALLEIFQRISALFLATAFEQGLGLPADQDAAAALFEQLATQEVGTPQGDGIRLMAHFSEPLAAIRTASMFRLGVLLRTKGSLDSAKSWLTEASARGHAMAGVELKELMGGWPGRVPMVAKDGMKPAKERATLMNLLQMESMKLPGAFQSLALSPWTGIEKWEACANDHQLLHVPKWQHEYGQQGEMYQLVKVHRFRSWLLSATQCWLSNVPEVDSRAAADA